MLNTKKKSDSRVTMYGSSVTGVCLLTSSCDIDIEFTTDAEDDSKLTHKEIMLRVLKVVQEMSGEPFKLKNQNQQPNKLSYEYKLSRTVKIMFNFTTGLYPMAHITNSLIRAYMELDERAKVLAFLFRYLARVNKFT